MSFELGQLNVSRETYDDLQSYVALVKKWNPRINLVSKRSLDELWDRHVVDSAQLAVQAKTIGNWLDMGSGGGFPGLVIAIISKELAPLRHVTLIESDKRKAAFLKTAARETGTPCTVLSARVEEAKSLNTPILSARALASLDKLLEYTQRHLSTDGMALFPKGQNWQNEVEKANQLWSFSCESVPSWTEPKAAILKIRDISRV